MAVPGMAVLAVDDLRFRYRRDAEELFDGLSYTFSRGAITAVTGPSGRGKSTLLYLIGLLLSPSSGQVLIDGATASGSSDRHRSELRAGRIGFVFQGAELDAARTIVDSVIEPGLYAGETVAALRPRAYELLERFGLRHRAEHRPGQISGGQAQRVAVCRALVNEPDIILADEPTGNLDRENATLVLDALSGAAHQEGRTVVLATHDPFVLDHADQRIEL